MRRIKDKLCERKQLAVWEVFAYAAVAHGISGLVYTAPYIGINEFKTLMFTFYATVAVLGLIGVQIGAKR